MERNGEKKCAGGLQVCVPVTRLCWNGTLTRPLLPLPMTTAHAPLIGAPPAPLESPLVIQDLVRIQLLLQSRIAAVRNASENELSFQAVEDQNLQIKKLFSELEAKLEVRRS